MTHAHDIGHRVEVRNQDMNGDTIIEGVARIVSLGDRDDTYRVEFGDDYGVVDRFIAPDAVVHYSGKRAMRGQA